MGISSSTPECPPCSPDIGQIGDGGMPSMPREPCHESTPPRKAVTRPCSPRGCERAGSESPADRRSSTSPSPYCVVEEDEEEEEEDETDCNDDDEEEECDDDEDDEDECEEDDEEVDEESEEQDETCSSSNVFTPCRDPVSPQSDNTSDEADCSENVLGEKREREETPVRRREEKAPHDEPISHGRSPQSRYPPCGQSTPQGKSPKFDLSPRRPQENQSIPQRNSPKPIFSPCRDRKPSATPQRSRSPSPSSSDKMRREKSPARQDRCIAAQRADVPRGRGKLNSPEQSVQSRGSQAIRTGADPCEESPNKQRGNESCDSSKADYSKKENQTAPSCEEIKVLQKGSAYLSKKEIRKVCDKYQRYGNFTDSESEGLDESNSTGAVLGNAYTLGFLKSFQDNSISPCSVSFEDRSKDYSGGSKPCSPAVKHDLKGNVVNLADAGSMQTCVTLQGAAQLSGGKCKTPYSDRNCRSRERKASPARKSSPNAYRGSPRRRATSRCRSHSPKKYTITCSRPSIDQSTGLISTTTTAATPAAAATAEHNKSDSNNSCWPKQTAQPHGSEGFETLQGLSDSNSNNLDDIDVPEASNTDEGYAMERVHSTSSVPCQPEQAVMDEMWFECWEVDALAGRQQSENKATVCSYRNQMYDNGNNMGTFQSFAMPDPNDSDIMQEVFACENIERDLPFIKPNTERSTAKAGGLRNPVHDESTLAEEKREDGKKGKTWYISTKKNYCDITSELLSAKMPAYARSRSLLHTLTKKLGAKGSFENINSNADSLVHLKKKSSHSNLGQNSSRGTPKKGQSSSDLQGKSSVSTNSHLQTSRDKMSLQGKLIFDTDLASKMGLSDTQIEQLINTIPVCGDPKSFPAKESNQSIVGIDQQKVAPGTQQAHQSEDTSIPGTSFQPRLFSVDLAQRMGLSLRQIQQLVDSTCKENYIKYILLAGETAFDSELAISMGLSREEVKLLADSSRLVNGKKHLPQTKTSSASEYFDASLARQIGLNENQIKLLINSIQSRMHSQPVFDPDLAIKMGLSTKQITQLGKSSAQTNRTFNVAVAKKMGLTDAQIQQLLASSVQVSPTSSGLQADGGQQLHIPDLNRAHDVYTQGVNQSNPFSAQISRRNSDLLKPAYQSYPDGDGWTRQKFGQRRQQLVYKLQVSMTGGNEVTNVLTTLIEWNSILLVVIFLLLLGTSCPGLARSILPCPLPSACEALHRFVISPLGLDQTLGQWTEPSSPPDSDEPAIWTFAWESVSGKHEKNRPQGIVYSGLYRLGKACVVTFGEVLSFALFRVTIPLVSAPFTLGEALFRLIYSSLLCTVRSGIYAIFYLSGAVLGIPVPSSPSYVQSEAKANALAPPKDREYSAQRPAVVKEKASQSAPLERPAVAGDTSSVPQVPPGQPIPTEADEMPPAPFNPDQPGALTPDLHELHQHGGFFIYMGFDLPKKGCNYSSITTTLLWLFWALPEECA